jgi:hypothetical protein
LADGVNIRIIQLMLGQVSIQQTQRNLNVTDEELRKELEVSWGRSFGLSQDSESADWSDGLSQICPTGRKEFKESGSSGWARTR